MINVFIPGLKILKENNRPREEVIILNKTIDEGVKENSQYRRVLEEVRDRANANYWG